MKTLILALMTAGILVGCSELKGKDGSDGVNGMDGKDGIAGVDGVDGSDGKDGEDGADGSDGKDGSDGADGADGSDGTHDHDTDGAHEHDTVHDLEGPQDGEVEFDGLSDISTWSTEELAAVMSEVGTLDHDGEQDTGRSKVFYSLGIYHVLYVVSAAEERYPLDSISLIYEDGVEHALITRVSILDDVALNALPNYEGASDVYGVLIEVNVTAMGETDHITVSFDGDVYGEADLNFRFDLSSSSLN